MIPQKEITLSAIAEINRWGSADAYIESLNSVIRKATKRRKIFPTEDSAKKVIYLAISEASKKWTMPIGDWKSALNRFMILFEDRIAEFI